MKNKRWTKEQLRYLKSRYLIYDNKTLLKGINARGPKRTIKALIVKGGRLKLDDKIKIGYVRLSDVHPLRNKNGASKVHHLCRKKAVEDGVAVRAKLIHSRPYIVPEWWADEYINWLRERDAIRQESKFWVTAKDFGKLINLDSETVVKYSKGQSNLKKYYSIFLKVRKKMMLKGNVKCWHYHPDDVKNIVKIFKGRNGPVNKSNQRS